jgi:hypothetical protein
VYHDSGQDLWIREEQQIVREIRGGFRIFGDRRDEQARLDHRYHILSRDEAVTVFQEAGIPLPPELKAADQPEAPARKSEDGTGTGLRGRLEFILDVFHNNPGPLRGREIAELARLEYDAHLRVDLSQLKILGLLAHDGRGYTRTSKPYPAS